MNFHSPKIYSHKEITDNQRRIHKNMFCLVWTIFVLLGMYRALHKLSLRIIIELDLSWKKWQRDSTLPITYVSPQSIMIPAVPYTYHRRYQGWIRGPFEAGWTKHSITWNFAESNMALTCEVAANLIVQQQTGFLLISRRHAQLKFSTAFNAVTSCSRTRIQYTLNRNSSDPPDDSL